MDESFELPALPSRDPDGHKGTFGTVAVVGGCAQSDALMFGAPALTARAALRAGSGLVRLVVPDPVLVPALQLIPEATGRGLIVDEDGCVVPHKAAGALDAALGDADVVAVGPGMGPGGEVEGVVLRALGQSEKPVVVDADGLNALSRVSGFEREVRAGAVFTPHPGEFSRLSGAMGLPSGVPSEEERVGRAMDMAARLGAVVVLKGAGTVVSDGHRAWKCGVRCAALAIPGSGDVLTGVIASLIGQFVPKGPASIGGVEMPRPAGRPLGLFEAACWGVELHALAGVSRAEAHGDAGTLAGELADALPSVLHRY